MKFRCRLYGLSYIMITKLIAEKRIRNFTVETEDFVFFSSFSLAHALSPFHPLVLIINPGVLMNF